MHIRNGIRTTLRSKPRTILFTALITVLTLVLTLGIEMWGYCDSLMMQIDNSYTSIVLAEYIGEDYPDDTVSDESAREALTAFNDDAVGDVEGVKLWEHTDRTVLLTDYKRITSNSPYYGYGVVVASGMSPMNAAPDWDEEPASETVLPETCIEIKTDTMEATLYADGKDPLELSVYYSTDSKSVFSHYVSVDGTIVSEDVTAEELPELYLLHRSFYTEEIDTAGYIVVGEIPDGYVRTAPVYFYYPDSDSYKYYGVHSVSYSGRISQIIYAPDNRENGLAVFYAENTDFVPESGKKYLLNGYYNTNSGYINFEITDFYEGCETSPWLELTDENDPALTEGIFADFANRYRAAGGFAYVEASADISSLEVFQQGSLYLNEGRFPEAGEGGVCVISGSTAEQMGVKLGDTVEVSVMTIGSENWYDMTETGDIRSWEIVGITKSTNDYSGWFWVSDAEGGFSSPMFGYGLGRAVLENRYAVQAVDELWNIVPENVRLTLYDQGYTSASKPIQDMRTAAIAVTASSVGGALAVLFLFAYLFVGRQRETVQVLVSLGTPSGKIRLWLLSGASLIASVSSVLGACLGHLSIGKVIDFAVRATESLGSDTRYSDAALGVMLEPPTGGAVPIWYAITSGAAIFVVSIILCLAFLRYAKRAITPKKGKISVRTPKGKTSLLGRGAPRFAIQSALRGGWRTAIVPAAALVLTLLLGLLAVSASGWQRQLDTVYETSAPEGRMVSTDGRNGTRLYVSMSDVRSLWQTGHLEKFAVSMSFPDSEIIALNSLSAAPEFYYSGTPEVEWIDGFDESIFGKNEYYSILYPLFRTKDVSGDVQREVLTYPAVVSLSYLEEHDLAPGDETQTDVHVSYFHGSRLDLTVPIKIVGTFSQGSGDSKVYVPLSFWCDPAWIVDGSYPAADSVQDVIGSPIRTREQLDRYIFGTTNFGTCRFDLSSGYDLEPFRRFLADGEYSQVGKLGNNRITVLLLDQSFQKTVGGLRRYITFGRILFPVLFLAVGLLGFIISRLMVNGRRMEFAIMRGLGASHGRVFASFFLEQGALCCAGVLVGALALTVINAAVSVWLASAGFLVCYLAGCAFAILSVGRTKLMSLLSERE